MSEFCEHETFKDICGICHRDALITALRAENERLRAALEKLSCKCPSNCDWEKHGDICPSWVARAALSHQEQKGGE